MQPYLVALHKRFGKIQGSFVNFPPLPGQQVIAFHMRLLQAVQILVEHSAEFQGYHWAISVYIVLLPQELGIRIIPSGACLSLVGPSKLLLSSYKITSKL